MVRLILLIILMCVGQVQANQPIAEVKVLSNVASYQPGEEFLVGVFFKINPGWHIYWRYPGKLGLPTKFSVESNVELEESGWQYPAPEEFLQAQDEQAYGYSDTVLFVNKLKADHVGELDLKVKMSWLSCGYGQCIPSRQEFDLKLPSAKVAQFQEQEVFKGYVSKFPRNTEDQNSPVKLVQSNWSDQEVEVILEWQQDPGDFKAFIAPPLSSRIKLESHDVQKHGLSSVHHLTFDRSVDLEQRKDFILLLQLEDQAWQAYLD